MPFQYQDPCGACTHGDSHCWALSSMKGPNLGVCTEEVLKLLNLLLFLRQEAKTPLSHAWMTPQHPGFWLCPPLPQALSGSTGMFPAKTESCHFRPQLRSEFTVNSSGLFPLPRCSVKAHTTVFPDLLEVILSAREGCSLNPSLAFQFFSHSSVC